MSPALLANTGVGAGQRNTNGSVTLSPQERDEQLQRAFQQGVEHAERRLGEQDLSREASALQGQLASQEAQNEEQQRALAQRIEELQRRTRADPLSLSETPSPRRRGQGAAMHLSAMGPALVRHGTCSVPDKALALTL